LPSECADCCNRPWPHVKTQLPILWTPAQMQTACSVLQPFRGAAGLRLHIDNLAAGTSWMSSSPFLLPCCRHAAHMPESGANAARLAQAQQLLALATQLQLGYPAAGPAPAASPRAAAAPQSGTQITDITETAAAAAAAAEAAAASKAAGAAGPAAPNTDMFAAALLQAAGASAGATAGASASDAANAAAGELYAAALNKASSTAAGGGGGGGSGAPAGVMSPGGGRSGGIVRQTSDIARQAKLARQASDLSRQTSPSRHSSGFARMSGLARDSSGLASFLTAVETGFAPPGAFQLLSSCRHLKPTPHAWSQALMSRPP
jgi:hypothetical protein